jgi:hypothetical protein
MIRFIMTDKSRLDDGLQARAGLQPCTLGSGAKAAARIEIRRPGEIKISLVRATRQGAGSVR